MRLCTYSTSTFAFDRLLHRQECRVLCLAWHDSGKYVVTGGTDSIIRIICVLSGACKSTFTLDYYTEKKCTVWDLKFISNSVLISASSVGKIQMWDFQTSTLRSTFNVHNADVLALAMGVDTGCIFASGVDSVILKMSQVVCEFNESGGQSKWIPSGQIHPHRHDVFSLHVSSTGMLASGGVEGDLVITNTHSFNKTSYVKYQPFPCMSRNFKLTKKGDILLFQDISMVRLWCIAHACSESFGTSKFVSVSNKGRNNNSVHSLPAPQLKSTPYCLLQLKSKPPYNILSSTMSPDGREIAVSNSFEIWVYRQIDPKKLILISNFPHPSSSMLFTPNQQKLLLATTTEGLKCVTYCGRGHGTIDTISNCSIRQFEITTDGKYLATVTKNWGIAIFDIDSSTCVAKIPQLQALPIVITFNPSNPELIVYAGGECRQVFVYNLKNDILQDFGKVRRGCKNEYFHGRAKLSHPLSILPIESERNLFVIYDNDCVILFRLNPELNQSHVNPSYEVPTQLILQEPTLQVQLVKSASLVIFVGISHAEDQQPRIIVVEKSARALLQALPPTFYRKRFGT